jgi:dolichol kinase
MFNFLTKSILRNKEYNAVGPQIYLVIGAVFSYLLYAFGWVDIMIVYSGLLIACFSDAIAVLIGRRFGNHKVECIGGETKTIEGFIAGIACSYIIGLITVGPFYSIIATLIFFLLDYFPLRVADNILNPIVITIVLDLLSYFIGFPIGIYN